MSDIFLGYSRADIETAEKVAAALERSGWSVFWDTNIVIGTDFEKAIDDELKAARCVVVLWSSKSVKSDWVRAEAKHGRDHGKLVPAAIEEVSPPFPYGAIQTANLVGWGGTVRHKEFERLVSSIAVLAGNPKGSPEYLKRVRKRAHRDLVAAVEKRGFRKSPRSDRYYYWAKDAGLRLCFLNTVVRVEEKRGGRWRRRDSFDLLQDSERFLDSL